METETLDAATIEAGPEVMAAVESDEVDHLVIADINSDDAYLKVPVTEAASLPAWR